MRRDSHPVTAADARPAGYPGECFYCRATTGTEHVVGCVARQRTVVVRVQVEYVIHVPEDWDAEMIDFHRNESSWCAGNILPELTALNEAGCLCPLTSSEYLREATTEDEERSRVFASHPSDHDPAEPPLPSGA